LMLAFIVFFPLPLHKTMEKGSTVLPLLQPMHCHIFITVTASNKLCYVMLSWVLQPYSKSMSSYILWTGVLLFKYIPHCSNIYYMVFTYHLCSWPSVVFVLILVYRFKAQNDQCSMVLNYKIQLYAFRTKSNGFTFEWINNQYSTSRFKHKIWLQRSLTCSFQFCLKSIFKVKYDLGCINLRINLQKTCPFSQAD